MPPKSTLIKTGDFFFKYRNALFPIVLVTLFLAFRTHAEYFGSELAEQIKDKIAVAVAIVGLMLRGAVIGFRYIKRGGLAKKVYADDLVTDGFFAVCRNPLYVANIIIYAGVLAMHGSPAVFLIGMAFFLFVYHAIVAAEEYFLRGKFGPGYDAYCADVPRWGFRLSRLAGATEGMKFNFKRALVKDYGTIANVIVSLTLLECLEDFQFYPMASQALGIGMIAATVVLALCVRVAKKQGVLTA